MGEFDQIPTEGIYLNTRNTICSETIFPRRFKKKQFRKKIFFYFNFQNSKKIDLFKLYISTSYRVTIDNLSDARYLC